MRCVSRPEPQLAFGYSISFRQLESASGKLEVAVGLTMRLFSVGESNWQISRNSIYAFLSIHAFYWCMSTPTSGLALVVVPRQTPMMVLDQRQKPSRATVADNNGMILLTDATGYVGGRLLPLLEGEGYQVRCMTRWPDALRATVGKKTEVVKGLLVRVVPATPTCFRRVLRNLVKAAERIEPPASGRNASVALAIEAAPGAESHE